MNFKQDLQRMWMQGGLLYRIIMLNVGVFLAIHLIGLIALLTGLPDVPIEYYLSSTSDMKRLVRTPWTIITYMFTHVGLMHIAFNMIILNFGGRIFGDLLGDKRLLGNYVLGGLSGLLLYIISYNFLPAFSGFSAGSSILGASAAVMGVFIGIATYRPELEVSLVLIGRVKLKWIALVILILDLVSIRNGVNSGGHIAHIGGALYGYIASRQLTKGNDISLGFVDRMTRFFNGFKGGKKSKLKVEKRPSRKAKKAAAKPVTEGQQEKIDAVLDKISRSGYESLTKAEKDLLFRASNER